MIQVPFREGVAPVGMVFKSQGLKLHMVFNCLLLKQGKVMVIFGSFRVSFSSFSGIPAPRGFL